MTKRSERKVETKLPRAAPSAKFLATGPGQNAKARRRIASAGNAVAKSGKWPTLERVGRKDERIKPATLDRNSDALDPARRLWVEAKADKIVDAGDFPTMALLHPLAGGLRLSFLARFEDALLTARRRWVAVHGEHPDWCEDPADGSGTPVAATVPGPVKGTPALEAVTAGTDELALAKRQVRRLMDERIADRARIKELRTDLAEAREALRRAMAINVKRNAAELNKPSASTRS